MKPSSPANPTAVPFVDLPQQYEDLREEITPAVHAVFERCDFVLGAAVEEFEAAFAGFVDAKHAIGVASGTDALHLILRAMEIGPGDEVITVANTFIATVQAISYAGATPVLVDCDTKYALIDPDAIEAAITPCTRAIMPVHLYGQPANMEAIMRIADARGIPVIEDAAQAHGARLTDNQACGSIGTAAAFSFYPGKNLGAYGDGGAITTNDDALAERIRLLRNWGSTVKYHHEVKGFNSRLDTVQAAILDVKLRHLKSWNQHRQQAATWYRKQLAGLDGVIALPEAPWTDRHVYHLFVVRLPYHDRAAIMRHLGDAGIQTGIHYPVPIHLQPAYTDLGLQSGAMPVSEKLADEIISLPMFPEITEEQVNYVVSKLRKCLK